MCQYCTSVKTPDHICPVRLNELSTDGVSPGKPARPDSERIDPATLAALRATPRLPQRQDDLTSQLHDLILFGTKLGLYDAVDWILNKPKN